MFLTVSTNRTLYHRLLLVQAGVRTNISSVSRIEQSTRYFCSPWPRQAGSSLPPLCGPMYWPRTRAKEEAIEASENQHSVSRQAPSECNSVD